jgi:hypothetical protein
MHTQASEQGIYMREYKKKHVWWHWLARILLFLVPLELLLTFIPIPQQFEAGVWHVNSYRDRIVLQSKELVHKKYERYPLRGYRTTELKSNGLHPKMVVLGDSRFYGQYVSGAATFSAYLNQNTDWDILNLGLPGTSIYEANDFILDDAIDFGPEVALLCYDINSSLSSVMTRSQGGSRSDVSLNILRSSMVYRWLELSWYALTQHSVPVMSLEEYKEELTSGISRLQSSGVDVVLVLGWGMHKDYPGLYTRSRYDLFREASRVVAKELDTMLLDVEEIMEGQDSSVMFVGEERIHFSTDGHIFFAKHLMHRLNLEIEDDQ